MTSNIDLAWAAFDGLMLSDSGLLRREYGAAYNLNLSKPQVSIADHLKYERWIKDNVLNLLNIPVCEGHPRVLTYTRKGELVPYARLESCSTPLLIEPYDDWYHGGQWVGPLGGRYIRGKTKKLPGRLMQADELLVPTLVHWFIGDGCCTLRVFRNGEPKVYVDFSVCNFTNSEVVHLMHMLNNVGILTTEPFRDNRVTRGSGLRLCLSSRTENSNRFMELIEPYMIQIFGDSTGPSYKDMVKRVPSSP